MMGFDAHETRKRLCAAVQRVLLRLKHQKGRDGGELHAAARSGAFPHAGVLVVSERATKRKPQEKFPPLGAMCAADKREVALPRRDTCVRDADAVDAGRFLAHEGT